MDRLILLRTTPGPEDRRIGRAGPRRTGRHRAARAALALGLAVIALQGCASAPGGPQRPTTRSPERAAAAPAPGFSPDERARIAAVDAHVRAAAARNALEPDLVRAVIWVESRFDPRAQSSAGARGLMQLMPATASELARRMGRPRARSFDPEFNVSAGSHYLARLLTRYDGDLRWALAAYHAGPGNADRWKREGTLPESSERYVARVLAARARFRGHDERATPPPAAAPSSAIAALPPQRPALPQHAALAKLPAVPGRPRLELRDAEQPVGDAAPTEDRGTAGASAGDTRDPAASPAASTATDSPATSDPATAETPVTADPATSAAAPPPAADTGAAAGLVSDADAPASPWSGEPLPSLPTAP
jgi:hypothetical protein